VTAPADLSPPVKVAELELLKPWRPIAGCGGFSAVRLLVRASGRPLGWLTIEEPGAVVEPGCIQQLLLDAGAGLVARSELTGRTAEPLELPPMSVVVCTRDRAASLRTCLTSLARLDYPNFEVVVVDNASATDETARVAAEARVRLVREERPGLDWARNRGVEAASHDLIAMTDDDVRVDGGWLRAVAAAFAEPDIGLVTGLVAPAELDTEAQLIFEYHYGGMGKGLVGRRWDPDRTDWVALLGSHHLGVGANMAFRRAVWARLRGFDTGLDVGTPSRGGGDLDFFHRVLVAGVAARYEPRALVWHAHRRELNGLARQLRDNGRAFAVYLMTQGAAVGERPGAVSRGRVARYATSIWLRWLLGRAIARFRRREKLSFRFQLEEVRGLLSGPTAYRATRRNDAALRRAGGGQRA
jgi:glycosyltransferase involved in cell wall biosynthesis